MRATFFHGLFAAFLSTFFLLPFSFFGQPGLRGEYFDGVNFDKFVGERTDAQLNFRWNWEEPMRGQGATDFSIRWTGRITSGRSGEHLFRAIVDDGLRVFIDGKAVIDAWGLADSETRQGKIWLEAGRDYELRVEYFNEPNEGELQLRWQLPGDEPLFGGAFGFNDRPIPAAAFSKNPPRAVAVSKAEKPSPERVEPPKKAEKPAGKVVGRDANNGSKPSPKPAENPKKAEPKPAAERPAPNSVSGTEVEKFLPKNVQFRQSKAEMLPESTAELERLAGFLVRNPAVRLRIEGHTDTVGDRAANLELSKSRARSVAFFLIEKGVAADRLEHEGYGSERPLTRDESPAGCAKNRRVEFLVLEK